MSTQTPTTGRIVQYTLSDSDVNSIRDGRRTELSGRGNFVEAGQVYPMMITRVWDTGYVNGQVFLDGNDTLWVTSASEGEGPAHYTWPVTR